MNSDIGLMIARKQACSRLAATRLFIAMRCMSFDAMQYKLNKLY